MLTGAEIKMIIRESFQWLVQYQLVSGDDEFKYLTIMWINYDRGFSGGDTCQEEGGLLPAINIYTLLFPLPVSP